MHRGAKRLRLVGIALLVAASAACAPTEEQTAPGSIERDLDAVGGEASPERASSTNDEIEGWPEPEAPAASDSVAFMHTDRGEVRFTYRVTGGVAIAQGDIEIPPVGDGKADARSAAASWTFRRWPSAKIPYTISADLPEHARVAAAIAHWEATTPIRFSPRTTESDYVEFRSGAGCSSSIGRIGNRQYVRLSTGESASNVIGVGVDRSNDRVYYYYKRGFATVGSTTRADAYGAHFKYTLPAGKTPADVVDVAVGAGARVFTWYKDGTVSEGSFTDLGAHGAAVPAALPAGKTWTSVLAIALDAQGKAYAFYRDGTSSVGRPTDLAAHAPPAAFTLPPGKTATQLAHADVTSDGSFFAVYTNGETSTGTASALGGTPTAATTPAAPARVAFPGNCSTGTVIHEIGHAVGLLHEQTRLDRDDHVIIHFANIQAGKASNFEMHSVSTAADHGPYDFDSVMHYGSFAFSSNGQPTIVKKDGSTITGNRSALSAGDLASVASMYP